MTNSDIVKSRLINQHIAEPYYKKPEELVAWMGAMQAQDYAMAKWAIGLRLLGATDSSIEKAIDEGKIIRTHLMRPTWHFVAAKDVRWMLALTAPQLLAASASRHKQLELDDKIFKRSATIIEKLLRDGNHLTREEIMKELGKSGIKTDEQRAVHLMFYAELDGLVCNGIRRGKQFTYALLDERVKPTKSLLKEEALSELCKRYFSSRTPATLQDFCWWSGLSVANAKTGLEAIKSKLESEKIETNTYYWISNSIAADSLNTTRLLPAFDEYLISYKDRSAVLDAEFTGHALSSNGIFYPIIVVNGKAIGTWKRTVKKEKVAIELNPFTAINKSTYKEIALAANVYDKFIEKTVESVTLLKK